MFNRASRRAAAKQPPVPTTRPLSEAPEKLRNLAGALRALEQTHALLSAGLFPGQHAAYVQTSLAFVETMANEQRAALEAQPEYAEFFKAKQS